jgi:WD40 repeat protein
MMMRRMASAAQLLGLLGLCGCAGVSFPLFGESTAAVSSPSHVSPAVATTATTPATPVPVEVELASRVPTEAKSTEAVLRSVLDAYSHVPLEPILRIETQAHLRAIHALALAPRGKELATASIDRTVRLWDPANGKAAHVLRPPTGRRGAGTTYALAYSPDGKLLATSGLTFFSRPIDQLKRSTFLIYFFDPVQQVVTRTLEGLPGRVHHLAWSHNGRYLAAAYGSDNVPELGPERVAGASGVRIYDAKTLVLLRETTTETPCQWAEFDSAQQLHAVCQRVVLQYNGLQLSRMRESESGAFHKGALAPDGRTLAVSHQDSTRVDLLDTADLSLRQRVSQEKLGVAAHDIGELTLAWSQGGSYLYAAGRRLNPQMSSNRLFKWPATGNSPPAVIDVGQMDALAMITGRDGRVFIGTSAATVLTLDSQDRLNVSIDNATIDSDNRPGGLRVSPDGRSVAYSDDNAGAKRFVFSLDRRTLLPWEGAKNTEILRPALIAGEPQITDWRLGRQVMCAGKPLDLGNSVAQNLAIDPRGRGFVIGTDSSVIHYDRQCRRKWETLNQARSIAVAIADEAGLALSQDEAGVIRWMRLNDGEKLLSFFPSLAGRSWTTWTPLGHYDASAEGEALVGWHVNRDRHREALFYGAGRFRDLFHNPDEITRSLTQTDRMAQDAEVGRALELGRAMRDRLPPQVSIVAVQEKAGKEGLVAQVSFSLRVPAGDAAVRVRALVNGRPAGTALALAIEDGKEEVNGQIFIPVPEEEVEIALIAETRSVTGEPAKRRLHERLADGSAAASPQQRPRLYALVVGVAKYESARVPPLDFPAKDARDFAQALRTQSGQLYRTVDVRLLTDEKATRESIIDGMDWLRREVTANDIAVVFFAGHGVNDSISQYYFLPSNSDISRLRSTAISNVDIVETLQSLPSKVLAFLDTCHSGNVLGTGKKRALGDINRLVNELTSAENGVVVFASSTGQETSQESPEWNNGAFTKALVEGLAGRGDFNHDGVISLNELNLWVADRVKELSGGEQHANMIRPDSIRDFPFSLIGKQ